MYLGREGLPRFSWSQWCCRPKLKITKIHLSAIYALDCTVPGDCDNPIQEMSRNRLYRRACRVAYPPPEKWAVELSWDSEALPAAFVQRNMDENAFTLVWHKRLISPQSFTGNYILISRSPLFAVFVFFRFLISLSYVIDAV